MEVSPVGVKTLLVNGITDDDEAMLISELKKMTLKQLKALTKNLKTSNLLGHLRKQTLLIECWQCRQLV